MPESAGHVLEELTTFESIFALPNMDQPSLS